MKARFIDSLSRHLPIIVLGIMGNMLLSGEICLKYLTDNVRKKECHVGFFGYKKKA